MPIDFAQTDMPSYSERTIMKIRGNLVVLLVEIAPEAFNDYAAQDGNKTSYFVLECLNCHAT